MAELKFAETCVKTELELQGINLILIEHHQNGMRTMHGEIRTPVVPRLTKYDSTWQEKPIIISKECSK